jgi:mannose-6-phosphate isomerase-like protein (cupin superfamily)
MGLCRPLALRSCGRSANLLGLQTFPGFTMTATDRRYQIVRFDDILGVPCPCGNARRAFQDVADYPATVHRTEIHVDARKHYHRRLTETYYILECGPDAAMELDDEVVPVSPGTCVLIPPGVRHRAVGRMTVLIFVLPKFDPADEWFD